MLKNIPKDQIKGYECKHVFYVEAQDGSDDDLLVIKEKIHLKDGRIIPNVRFIENFERDFWITKPGFRTYEQKKEWEDIDKVQKFTSTQRKLPQAIARALGNPGLKGSLRMLSRTPYLYGTDISTPALAKRKYMDSFPDCISENTVAVLDIETDVVKGHELPICIALTFKDRCFLAVTEEFIGTIPNPNEKLQEAFDKYLGEYKESRNIKLETMVVNDAGQAIVEVIKRAHLWMPDFIAIWNIDYDLPKIFKTLKQFDIPVEDVFCHPSLPRKYKTCQYIQGSKSKLTASGKHLPLHQADQWHVFENPASFYFIDAMCVYKRIRVAKGNEPSYKLDYILNKNLNLGKLRFKEADQYSDLDWHVFMQKNYRIEYGIYNLFDCIGVELLDEKTKDLASTISVLCEHSEYSKYPSQPRRTCDDLHFVCLQHGKVIGTTSDKMEHELDELVVGMENWIVTLPSYLVEDNGLKVVNEIPDIRTMLRGHVLD